MALSCPSLSELANLDLSDPVQAQEKLQQCMAMLLDPHLWWWAIGITFACALIGALMGRGKGHAWAGAIWGATLGPIGWLIVTFLKPDIKKMRKGLNS